MPPPEKSKKGKEVCVNCGRGVRGLYVQYSPGNIRLIKCENCKATADPYIECEFMIVLIDLILHKPQAYRHLLYNMLNLESSETKRMLWTASLSCLLLDACRISLLKISKDEWNSPTSSSLSILTCGKVLLDVLLGNLMFISFLFLGTRVLFTTSINSTRYMEVLLAILLSSYFKIFLIAMMVWEFPPSVLFIIDIFVLSSNTVALKVLTELRTSSCIGVCCGAHTAKFFTCHWLLPLILGL